MKYEVRKICCVCKIDLGPADWKADRPNLKTHSYCKDCYKSEMAKIERSENGNKTESVIS